MTKIRSANSKIQSEDFRVWLVAFKTVRRLSSQGLEKRLNDFLSRASALLSANKHETVPEAYELTPIALKTLISTLAGPLASARMAGTYINVWQVAGLGRHEVRTASVLAWLLDPRGSHGRGDGCLRAFFARATKHLPAWDLGDIDLTGASIRTELRPQGSERDRVDIAVEGADFIVFLEIKIDAALQHGQLQRYSESAEAMGKSRWRLIYLSPNKPTDLPSNTVHLTWRDVETCFNKSATPGSFMLPDLLFMQFEAHIRQFT